MTMKMALPVVALSTVLLSACSSPADEQQAQSMTQVEKTIPVEVIYRDRSMQPPGSELVVTLSDVSKMDVAATVLATETIEIQGAPPYKVNLSFAQDDINARHRYSVSAKIMHEGELRYITTQNNDPFGKAQQQTPVKVMLERVAKPNSSLTNTYWKATTVEGNKVEVIQKEPFIKLGEDGRVSGFLGCNNVTGKYVKAQHFGLRFDGLASTRKMCMKGMEQEDALNKALSNTFSAKINGENLALQDEQGNTLATFKAVYF